MFFKIVFSLIFVAPICWGFGHQLKLHGEQKLMAIVLNRINDKSYTSVEDMQFCLESSYAALSKINDEYYKDFAECNRKAENDRKDLNTASTAERQNLLESGAKVSDDLHKCEAQEDAVEFFKCYKLNAMSGSKTLRELSGQSNTDAILYEKKRQEIQINCHLCTTEAENKYRTNVEKNAEKFDNCLAGAGWPDDSGTTTEGPIGTPTIIPTDEPGTDDPETTTTTTEQPGTEDPNTTTTTTEQPGTDDPNTTTTTEQPGTEDPNTTTTTTEQPETEDPNTTTTTTEQPGTEDPDTTTTTEQPETEDPNTTTTTEQPETEDPNTTTTTEQPETENPDTTSTTTGESGTEDPDTTTEGSGTEDPDTTTTTNGEPTTENVERSPEEDLGRSKSISNLRLRKALKRNNNLRIKFLR